MRKKQKYIPYDYESEFQEDCTFTEGEAERIINQERKALYATKTAKTGLHLYVDVYPEFTRLPAGFKQKEPKSSLAQRNLNEKNARKELEMLLQTNFTEQDNWYTLSYAEGNLPDCMDRARKDAKNWIKAVNRKRKAKELPNARYIYVIEWAEGKKKVRCHIHCVMDGALSMEETLAAWKLGRRLHARPLAFDESGLSGLSRYISKESPAGEKRWAASVGLKRPRKHKNHRTFGRRRVEEVAKKPATLAHQMEQKYPAYWFVSGAVKWNGFNGLYYLSAQMRTRARSGDVVRLACEEQVLEQIAPSVRRMMAGKRMMVVETDREPGREKVRVQLESKTYTLPARAVLVVQRE